MITESVIYNAWDNCLEEAGYDGMALRAEIEPLKSFIAVFDGTIKDSGEVTKFIKPVVRSQGNAIDFMGVWKRSICS